jgi:hypothetical protein
MEKPGSATASPIQFSSRSAAYWTQASSTHVQNVRDSVSNLFMNKQSENVELVANSTVHAKKFLVLAL